MHTVPLACFLSLIRPPGIQFEDALLQIAPVNKNKCPFIRNDNDIQFLLFTKYNPQVGQELVIDDDDKLMASNFDFHADTVIYFHAFMERIQDSSALRVREAYMVRGEVNMIMVDASRLEAGPWYFTAAENTWYIGNYAARFIDYLVSRGLDLKRTHLIGHSLGGQSAGVAGTALTSGRVSRITGLDPALPLFAKLPLEQRLDPSDAEFVDVIHTDAGIFGVSQPTGHADFYPNGGISPQPGCELEIVLHQQLLFNKCDNRTDGFYGYQLKPTRLNKKQPVKTEKNRIKPVSSRKKHAKNLKRVEKYDYFNLKNNENDHILKTIIDGELIERSHVKKRQKRFVNLFKRQESEDTFFFKILEFLNKNRKNVIPVFTVMREINTLVKSANGELNHSTKERNNYIGANPPVLPLATYNLELGNESRVRAFVKRLLGLKVQGDRLTITGK